MKANINTTGKLYKTFRGFSITKKSVIVVSKFVTKEHSKVHRRADLPHQLGEFTDLEKKAD